MKRAIVLILVLTILCVTGAALVDAYQTRTAERYLEALPALRKAVVMKDLVDARARESLLYATWQHDTLKLNIFISHHHTRAVSSALLQLSTAVEMGWQDEALKAIDLLKEALSDICFGACFKWATFF